jgi:hypothetical protein
MKNLISKDEKDQIDFICTQYNIKNYSINPDGTIDVDGAVNLSSKKLTDLPIKFNKVSGNFNCGANILSSLKGAPKIVGGNFSCYVNKLTTLDGGPTIVDGGFSCWGNIITSLDGSPDTVAFFNCSANELTNLIGSPTTVNGDFACTNNKLISLEGSPTKINGDLSCTYNKIISTYSGDTDIELTGEFLPDKYLPHQATNDAILPKLLRDNITHIKLIMKYQRHFFIWNDDLSLNEENFQVLIEEINDGL